MSCQEIPDQLQEKLSLGLLGWETVVRLDWELDKGVPEVSIYDKYVKEMVEPYDCDEELICPKAESKHVEDKVHCPAVEFADLVNFSKYKYRNVFLKTGTSTIFVGLFRCIEPTCDLLQFSEHGISLFKLSAVMNFKPWE